MAIFMKRPFFFKQMILLLGDVAIFYIALFLGLYIRYGNAFNSKIFSSHLLPFSLLYLVWLIVFYIDGLYDITIAKNNLIFLRLFFESMLINALIATGFFYFIPIFGISPKTNLFIILITTIILFYLWRNFYNQLIPKLAIKNSIIFIEGGNEAKEISEILSKRPELGFEPIALYESKSQENEFNGLPIIHNLENLKNILAKKSIDTIVLPMELKREDEVVNFLYSNLFKKFRFLDLVSFYELIVRRIPLSVINETWFLHNLQESDKKFYDKIKTILDYLLGFFLFIILGLIIIPIAIAIKLGDGGPTFYSQSRVGRGGKIFKIYKFRTMKVDAEKNGAQFTKNRDSRVTRIGNFLRKTRLDELPQVINILKNEMSFIGPRPERPEFVEELKKMVPFYDVRHIIKPGLTGWAQINYHYAATLEENLKKLQYDLFYIKNRSLILDSLILLKTLNIILKLRGQ
jgi:exopolysaccharide biosynthesis polyprenyl glycosylphosphotransferase